MDAVAAALFGRPLRSNFRPSTRRSRDSKTRWKIDAELWKKIKTVAKKLNIEI